MLLRPLTAAVLALLAAVTGPQPEAPRRAPGTTPLPDGLGADPPPFRHVEQQRGVALGMFAEDISFSYAPLLAEIVALGATHVALVVPLYQTDGASRRHRACTRACRRR